MKCNNIKCEKDHDSSFGSGKFCSKACANSRSFSPEAIQKKKEKSKETWRKGRYRNKCLKNFKEAREKAKKTWNEKLLNEDFSKLSFERLRKRIILEQNGKCNSCGIEEWLGKKLTLELEHIDGDRENNNRENLEALCPNCHSLTSTWRGRNKRKIPKKIDDETLLLVLIKNNWNMRQALIELDLSPKGGNYKRCHKLKRITE